MDYEKYGRDLWRWDVSNGGHYSKPVPAVACRGIEALREMFPTGEADELNFVLFSTSGVHGTYRTIEEEEAALPDCGSDQCAYEHRLGVTYIIVQPRLVAMRYGNCRPESPDDLEFLKKLRASSWALVSSIGKSR